MSEHTQACKHCIHWSLSSADMMKSQWGICDRLSAGDGIFTQGNGCAETQAGFGCVSFASRPIGPFQAVVIASEPRDVYVALRFRGEQESPVLPREVADKLQDWLNELWYGE